MESVCARYGVDNTTNRNSVQLLLINVLRTHYSMRCTYLYGRTTAITLADSFTSIAYTVVNVYVWYTPTPRLHFVFP